MKKLLFPVVLLFALCAPLMSHPGFGMAVAKDGTVYFSDVLNQTIWKFKPGSGVEAVLTERWAHHLALDGEGNLWFDHEEQTLGRWFTSLHKMAPDGTVTEVQSPRVNRMTWDGNAWTVSPDGQVYFMMEHQAMGNVLQVIGDFSIFPLAGGTTKTVIDGVSDRAGFKAVQAMIYGDDDRIYVNDDGYLRAINKEGIVTTIADDLVIDNPPNAPFSRGPQRVVNALYGLAKHGDTFYVAYYGNRQLYKVTKKGEASVLYTTQAPWSPAGVVVAPDGTIYVLESGRSENNEDYKGPRLTRVSADGKAEVLVDVGRDLM